MQKYFNQMLLLRLTLQHSCSIWIFKFINLWLVKFDFLYQSSPIWHFMFQKLNIEVGQLKKIKFDFWWNSLLEFMFVKLQLSSNIMSPSIANHIHFWCKTYNFIWAHFPCSEFTLNQHHTYTFSIMLTLNTQHQNNPNAW